MGLGCYTLSGSENACRIFLYKQEMTLGFTLRNSLFLCPFHWLMTRCLHQNLSFDMLKHLAFFNNIPESIVVDGPGNYFSFSFSGWRRKEFLNFLSEKAT
jgi:hypothetical protein